MRMTLTDRTEACSAIRCLVLYSSHTSSKIQFPSCVFDACLLLFHSLIFRRHLSLCCNPFKCSTVQMGWLTFGRRSLHFGILLICILVLLDVLRLSQSGPLVLHNKVTRNSITLLTQKLKWNVHPRHLLLSYSY